MKILRLLLVLSIAVFWGCDKKSTEPTPPETPPDLLEQLQAIEGFTVTELTPTDHFQRLFEIHLTQLLDHGNPAGPTFTQKIYVGHVDEALPVVYETEGYSRNNFRVRDLSPWMQCNQISVEHRFNGSSKPDSPDWQYLTIKQAADDLHVIAEKLKTIYGAGWVSTGRSKGGETAVFYRRFYPDDVDATVAFVAPLLLSERDDRVINYLNTVGDEECRNKIKSFQRALLRNVDQLAALVPGYVDWVNQTFDVNMTYSISYESVIKHAAIDYPFDFWSSTAHGCLSIPDSTASPQEMFDHLMEVIDIFLYYSDYGLDFWEGWYYQAQTEIGDYKLDNSHLADLIGNLDVLHGFGNSLVFDPAPMADVDNWVRTSGDRIIFIYGSEDPWTVAPFETSNLDVLKIINPGTKHETGIVHLNSANQSHVKAKLTGWLNYSF